MPPCCRLFIRTTGANGLDPLGYLLLKVPYDGWEIVPWWTFWSLARALITPILMQYNYQDVVFIYTETLDCPSEIPRHISIRRRDERYIISLGKKMRNTKWTKCASPFLLSLLTQDTVGWLVMCAHSNPLHFNLRHVLLKVKLSLSCWLHC